MDAKDREIVGVISAAPLAETPVSTVAEAVPGYVVAATVVDGPAVDLDIEPPHRNGKLKSVIECMLFVASEPISGDQIAQTLDIEPDRVGEAVASLQEDLNCGHGLQLVRVAGGFQLCTRPEYADYCSLVLQSAKRKLSRAALETLAVVAYRQPCTMPEIEAVRGVQIDGVIKTLLERGLIKEAGRKKTAGRPILYATTPEFLEYFGLDDLSELPEIDLLAAESVRALEAERSMLMQDSAA